MSKRSPQIDFRKWLTVVAIGLVMLVTITHVADYCGSFEPAHLRFLGWPYAIAVDLCVALTAYLTKWKTSWFGWGCFIAFTAMSGLLNIAHIQPWQYGVPAFVGAWVYAIFPTVAIALLGFLYRRVADFHKGASKSAVSEQPEQPKITTPQSIPQPASKPRFYCAQCDFGTDSQNKWSAHHSWPPHSTRRTKQKESTDGQPEASI